MAVGEADRLKAKGFLGDIAVSPTSNGFEITSDSGSIDYSTPPFPMLDKLLARGKTANDGSTYRVIPIGKPSTLPTQRNVKDFQAGVDAAASVKPRGSMTDLTLQMAAAFGMGAKRGIQVEPSKQSSGPVSFRVASSKQNPGSAWVIPARSADMAPALSDINAMMAGDISRAIDSAILELESEIQDVIHND
jgi:hypothetical protein